jgi:sulfhydrogenase subunit gamma (sulfur reductase)
MINIYQPQKVKVISVVKESVDTRLLRLSFVDRKTQKSFSYLPGQFMQIGLSNWGECPISICSSPSNSEKFFELSVRDVGNLTHKLNSLKKGDEVYVRGPYGNGFDTGLFKNQELLLIGGGCGFIPLRPLIKDVISDKLKVKSLKIFYGCLNEDTLLFKKELAGWNRKSELSTILEKPTKKWAGEKGMVTDLFKTRKVSPDSVVVMVGPPIMYRFVIKELKKKKIKDKNIYLSLENRMYCGVGVCQHCAIGPYYVCKDGPVFCYRDIKKYM